MNAWEYLILLCLNPSILKMIQYFVGYNFRTGKVIGQDNFSVHIFQ